MRGRRDVTHTNIDSSVTEIRERAFDGCRDLVLVKVHNKLRKIGDYAFYNCFSLSEIDIPSSVKLIGRGAFAWCGKLPPLDIPSSVEQIGEKAFSNCSFRNFRLPGLVIELRNGLFHSCADMVSIELPEHLERIDDTVFCDCARLRNVAISPSVTKTGTDVFKECRALRKVSIDDNELIATLKARFDGLPIHKLCYYQSYYPTKSTLANLKLERESLDASSPRQDCLGMTPLHILSLSTKPNLELFRDLVQNYPQDVVTKDIWGDLPIYYACLSNAPLEIMQLLLETHVAAFPTKKLDWTWMVSNSRLEMTQLLLETHKTTFKNQKVNWEKLIQHFARDSLTRLKCIVQYSLEHRLNQLGLEKWRYTIWQETERIPARQGLSMYYLTMRKRHLDLINSKLASYELIEKTSLVELAIWKETMDKSGGNKDDTGYRTNCRIICGAHIILSNVMSFLQRR
jgi:hypothetical protein